MPLVIFDTYKISFSRSREFDMQCCMINVLIPACVGYGYQALGQEIFCKPNLHVRVCYLVNRTKSKVDTSIEGVLTVSASCFGFHNFHYYGIFCTWQSYVCLRLAHGNYNGTEKDDPGSTLRKFRSLSH